MFFTSTSRWLPAWLIPCAVILSAATNQNLPTLKLVYQVQQLSVAEASRKYPVDVTGVVTYVDQGPGDMFVQDKTAGAFVFVNNSKTRAHLKAGQLVSVKGFTTPADYSPSITDATITVLGNGAFPAPKRLPFDQLLAGREDATWIEAEGVVRSGQIKSGLLFLNVVTTGGSFLGVMREFPADWVTTLVDSKVVIKGVVAAIFNEHRQSVATRIFIPGPDFIHVKEKASADGFDLPLSSTLSVGQFHPKSGLERRIRVRATVMAVERGVAIYISDGDGSLQVEAYAACSAEPGDLVDVVGFPAAIDSRPGLQDAVCRKVSRSPDEKSETKAAIPVTTEQVIPDNANNDPSGYGLSAGTRYDLKLVGIDGTLLQATKGPEGETWLLQDEKKNVTVKLPPDLSLAEGQPEIGSRLRLTGVCVLTFDRYRRAQFFRILVRRPSDIVTLSRPRWFNLRHALWSLTAAIFACMVALGYVLLLRKQVTQKTKELQEANGRLTRLSNQDFLTSTANRRLFDEALATEIRRAQRSQAPLSLIMIDIDHFKAVNDFYGHQTGDAYLIKVAAILESTVQRSSDLLARYGGEEFAAILPDTDREAALKIAETMRTKVLEAAIPHENSPLRFLSISLGISTAQAGPLLSAESLIERSDSALYEAKRTGRNRAVAPDPEEQPDEHHLSVREA